MLEKALALARQGMHVFPLRDKVPCVEHGHLEATTDEDSIRATWARFPDSNPGVATGPSGIVVLDVDVRGGYNGYQSLEDNWRMIPDTFSYDTPGGGGHHIYAAPAHSILNGVAGYQKMAGVDRRGGSSYVSWWGPVPESRAEIKAAPTWLLDPAIMRDIKAFQGDIEDWYESLTEGQPGILVRRAIAAIPADMSHSDMVSAQFNAVRLGGEGHPGVRDLINELRHSWLTRPPEAHTTPQSEWDFKFEEALQRAIELYGDQTDRVASLPEYKLDVLPAELNVELFVGEVPARTHEWTAALREIMQFDLPDDLVVSTLWNAPRTKHLAREWGIDFVYERVEKARLAPEPIRENPALEQERAVKIERPERGLLTDAEREHLVNRPTFVDYYVEAGKKAGFANEPYYRAAAWTVASLAFAFRGFIPVSATDKMGLNVWNITLGYSGSGKSRSIKFRDSVLDLILSNDGEETPYNLGSDGSPQGLHLGLLQRDRKPSFFSADEASRFFKTLAKSDWMSSLDDTMSHWYEGRVDPSNKISLKELRGKSALTSFHVQMFGTPDRMTEVLNRDMFLTGFLARFNWVLGPKPVDTDDRFKLAQQVEIVEFDSMSPEVTDVALDLVMAARYAGGSPRPILSSDAALARMSEAYRKMYRDAQNVEGWDIIEPSITRLAETMRKCAAISAMYRGSGEINMTDALHAIRAVEEWYTDLFKVAEMISAGDFQRDCDAIMAWLSNRGGKATRTQILYAFRNRIQKDPRELDARLGFLVESGRINRDPKSGTIRYVINDGSEHA